MLYNENTSRLYNITMLVSMVLKYDHGRALLTNLRFVITLYILRNKVMILFIFGANS